MEKLFTFIKQSRTAFIQLIDGLSLEELNHIPAGYSNNIVWNFGHIVVSTQTLCYVRTGVHADATAVKFNEAYKKGTKPSYTVSAAELAELKSLAISSIEQIELDYKQGLFDHTEAFETATYGALMQDFEEVLITTIGHDNLHFGYAAAQRKLIKQ